MNKTLTMFLFFQLLLVVCSSGIFYSNPTYEDGSAIDWDFNKVDSQPPVKTIISKDGYNQIFEDYQNGILTQKEASSKLKQVEINNG